MEEKRFLPIGSVVILKGGEKKVMITGYCIFPQGKEYVEGEEKKPELKMYEYGGCTYPEGILDTNVMLAFNHADIEKLIHKGYASDAQEKLSEVLDQHYEEVKQKFEAGEITKEQILGLEE